MCICAHDAYMDMYTCTCAPFLGALGSVLFNSNVFNWNSYLSNNDHSLQSLDFFLLSQYESSFLYFSTLSFFGSAFFNFICLKQSIFHLICSFHLLPFPRHFSFLVFFNIGYSFPQLIVFSLCN